MEDGADFAIYDKSQWVDSDGDNYGDNLTGNKADGCPETAGNSTKWYIVEFSSDGSFDVTYVTEDKFGCPDSDGDGFWDEADDLPNDPKDYIDNDKDGVGESQDYNDSNKLVKTLNDYCELFVEDESEDCQGARDADYQNYVLTSVRMAKKLWTILLGKDLKRKIKMRRVRAKSILKRHLKYYHS